jgi:hypothetical protein
MILITTFYVPNNKTREKEINKCLKMNYENPFIEKIILLNDKIYKLPIQEEEESQKIEQVIINNSPNYKLRFDDAINYINNSEECIGKLCILSNSDIYFNETLSKIDNTTLSNNVFALLRYDEDEHGNLTLYSENGKPRDNSQDCWIFKSPLKVNTNILNFEFGTLGCDNVFANIVYNSGIYISNPCYSIQSIHVHSSNYRTYNEQSRLYREYCNVVPCNLKEMPKIIYTNYWGNIIDK